MISRKLRTAQQNYALLIVLLLDFIIAGITSPWLLTLYNTGSTPFKTILFCQIWRFTDFAVWTMCQILVAWISFERHILIFHDSLLVSKWGKIALHYAPPFIVILYVTCFYVYALYFYPCANTFSFDAGLCTYPCYINYPVIGIWEFVVHYLSSSIFIILCSTGLLFRVVYSRRRFKQSSTWRKHSRMAFNLIINNEYPKSTLPR